MSASPKKSTNPELQEETTTLLGGRVSAKKFVDLSAVPAPSDSSVRERAASSTSGRMVLENVTETPHLSEFRAGRSRNILRAANSAELYKLGNSFFQDVQNGMKCFAFTHIDSADSQKKSILGIASFMNYFDNHRILIITNRIDGTFFSEFDYGPGTLRFDDGSGNELSCRCHVTSGFTCIETPALSQSAREIGLKTLSPSIKKLVEAFDVVLIDLPPTIEHSDALEAYFPMIQVADSVTFTVSLRKNRFSEVNKLMKYFMNYKIKIKGSIIDGAQQAEADA